MADSTPDFGSLAVAEAPVETPVVETPTTDSTTVETPEISTGATTETETPAETTAELNADGTAKTVATGTEERPAAQALEPTAQNVRNYLKNLKADSANAKVVKSIHEAYEHQRAFQEVFPSVQEARDAKDFFESVGGIEGLESKNAIIQNVEESDQLLYAGDPKLIDNIVEDLKAQGKQGALVSLTPAFLDAVKSADLQGFHEALSPYFLGLIEQVNLTGAVAGLVKALSTVDAAKPETVTAALETVKGISGEMDSWIKGLQSGVQQKKTTPVETPEQKKFKADQEAFNKQRTEFETSKSNEFTTAVNKEAERINHGRLITELTSYAKMPFFKGFSKESWNHIGANVDRDLRDTLAADKTYQTWMKAAWGAKNPDRSKILEYHKAKVESISDRVVSSYVAKAYPNYAKGGFAAGRTAAAETKKVATQKVVQQAAATGKAVFVATKPPRDFVDYTDRNQATLLEVAGKAKLAKPYNNLPVGTLITWRRNL